MDSISFMHTAAPVLAPTMLDGPSSLNLDLFRDRQSGAALFCENYAKLYFDAKHLEKGLNRGWWNFWFPFFQEKKKNAHFRQYWKLLKFSLKLDPAHHKIEPYDLLMVCPFDPGHSQCCLNKVTGLMFSTWENLINNNVLRFF